MTTDGICRTGNCCNRFLKFPGSRGGGEGASATEDDARVGAGKTSGEDTAAAATIMEVGNGVDKRRGRSSEVTDDAELGIPSDEGAATTDEGIGVDLDKVSCLLYTSPSPRDATLSRMPSSA